MKQSNPHYIKGFVVQNSMNKSGIVKVINLVKDSRYKKIVKRTTKVMFHDEKNITVNGDYVLLQEDQHFSKKKKFLLKSILNKSS